jgi:hypothetical protein
MSYSYLKRVYQNREKKIVAWGGVPKFLDRGVEPNTDQVEERKQYLQSLLPEELKENYQGKKPKRNSRTIKYKEHTKKLNRCYKGFRTKEKVEKDLLSSCKYRAKKKDLPFNLDLEDVRLPKVCPVFGCKFDWTGKVSDASPSLDRIIPELGYVKGNVCIISHKANRIKNNATIEELGKVWGWLQKETVQTM